ncbi:fimbria/pilus outer membrane usher protein, partial [Providencia rettgeri]|uniref:fimbria/pilus outer membrane usher protein n=3 Tax=Morganellaceae TaxID=1903414 RepID=UPI001C83936C
RSRLIIGKQFSDGYFFEPYKLTGVIFANSKDMWPESEYMFKPSIDGIVSQPSIIEIYQNNVLIKKEEVQSGKYEINDYNPLYYGGDLEVNVKDGSGKVITKYTVPYTAGSLFVNKNNFLYKFTAGRLSKNNSYNAELDNVYEAGVLYGLSDAVNLRYGYLHAERYNSLLNGLSVNSVIGLMSLDIQMSASRPISDEKTYSGFNLKTTYQKDLNWYNISNVVLSNNIYNAKSHRSLSQTYSKNNDSLIKQDSSIQLNGNVFNGSINFGGGLREYWDNSSREKYLSAGYNGRYNIVNYNFSVFRTDNDTTT